MQPISKRNTISGSFVISKELIEDLCQVLFKRMPKSNLEIVLTQNDKTEVPLKKLEEIFSEPNIGKEEITELGISFKSGEWGSRGYKVVNLHFGGFREGCGYSIEVKDTNIDDRDFVSIISLEIEKRILEGKSVIGTFLNNLSTEYIVFPLVGVVFSIAVLLSLKNYVSKDSVEGVLGLSMLIGWFSGSFLLFIFRKLYPVIIFDFSKRSSSYERIKKIRMLLFTTLVVTPSLIFLREFLWNILLTIWQLIFKNGN